MATELLLLPGLVCDQAVWAAQVDRLQATCNCHVPEYGDLDSITAMAESVIEAAPPRFALAGHSMGGRIALEIVRRVPHRVERLVLLDTGYQARPIGEAGEAEARQRARLVSLAFGEGMRTMALEWVQGMVHPQRLEDARLIGDVVAMVARRRPETFAAQVRALLARPEASDLLPQIGCPTWIVCGRQDGWSPLARHEAMAAMVPGAQLRVIEDSGHMSTMERPAAVTGVLQEWLGGA